MLLSTGCFKCNKFVPMLEKGLSRTAWVRLLDVLFIADKEELPHSYKVIPVRSQTVQQKSRDFTKRKGGVQKEEIKWMKSKLLSIWSEYSRDAIGLMNANCSRGQVKPIFSGLSPETICHRLRIIVCINDRRIFFLWLFFRLAFVQRAFFQMYRKLLILGITGNLT